MGSRPSRDEEAKTFFRDEIIPIIADLMQTSQLTDDEAFKLFTIFTSMDKDRNGSFSCAEFHQLLDIKHSLISERLFLVIDLNSSDNVGFLDFFRGVCKLKSFQVKDFAKFAFKIFDVDDKDNLSINECDALLRMVTGKKSSDQTVIRHIEGYCRNDMISLDRFIEAAGENAGMMQPLVDVQEKLRLALLEE